jgi:hypothetical protein
MRWTKRMEKRFQKVLQKEASTNNSRPRAADQVLVVNRLLFMEKDAPLPPPYQLILSKYQQRAQQRRKKERQKERALEQTQRREDAQRREQAAKQAADAARQRAADRQEAENLAMEREDRIAEEEERIALEEEEQDEAEDRAQAEEDEDARISMLEQAEFDENRRLQAELDGFHLEPPAPAPNYAELLSAPREAEEPPPDGAQLCVVCTEDHAIMAFTPCGHLNCCKYCANILQAAGAKCPTCRKEGSFMRVYLSGV